ncbi:histidine--tRNA ligase [Lyticum sinuosum]|uniref:Histidine--tRNA ligase n=1 Tax=Lyticum sinuosum TaxID=1332059 RepID=A0AAE5AHA6_9RICK|nr:histidine--tRNA ligase [Lyticum sinuosum]MDZ5761355.1 Histidine--tRNA ligase [Lyticum sinuosum]
MIKKISGFPEYLPQDQMIFSYVIRKLQLLFEQESFIPMDTAAVELIDTLLSKGNDHEIYGLYRLNGEEKKNLALRFDLTVPLARYVAQNYGQLIFPYRRYHIAPVWRGERAQSGRYRQFYQCDIDIIGKQNLEEEYDAEILSIGCKTLNALGLNDFVVKFSSRDILIPLMILCGFNEDIVFDAIKILDKSTKVSQDQIINDLKLLNCSFNLEAIKYILFYNKNIENSPNGKDQIYDVFNNLSQILEFNSKLIEGYNKLYNIIHKVELLGISKSQLFFDLSLARGLSYYSGIIFEIVSNSFKNLGSICAGGRYDNLVSSFHTKEKFPGVGMSIGISRLIPEMINKQMIDKVSINDVIIIGFENHLEENKEINSIINEDNLLVSYHSKIAQIIRDCGLKVQHYWKRSNLKKQLEYCNKIGVKIVIIARNDEKIKNIVFVKNMITGEQKELALEELYEYLKNIL